MTITETSTPHETTSHLAFFLQFLHFGEKYPRLFNLLGLLAFVQAQMQHEYTLHLIASNGSNQHSNLGRDEAKIKQAEAINCHQE